MRNFDLSPENAKVVLVPLPITTHDVVGSELEVREGGCGEKERIPQGLGDLSSEALDYIRTLKSELAIVEKVFDELRKRGVSPNSCSFNVMIGGHCRAGSGVSEVERWLKAMFEKGYFLDNGECTLVVDFFCKMGCAGKWGSIKQAFEVLKEMVRKGWKPNVYMHTTLIDGLCKKGWTEKAFRLFLKLVRSDSYKPNVHTYTAVIVTN
ncbi:hypothetical protein IFM89_022037 [Coptis chinensis]|uniref:Pentatricopeptide repeat-containing protein n=1 Tax=Coptis chinensis TaxID=261450 RepID=A0A835I587_9MAGN|nr:hypothetical protein IFM89_022037 [Coptis chinensis]